MLFDDDNSEYSLTNTTPLPNTNSNILTIAEASEPESESSFTDADEFTFEEHVDTTYKNDIDQDVNESNTEHSSDPDINLTQTTDVNQSANITLQANQDKHISESKYTNLDQIQLNNLQLMPFDYSTFVNRISFKQFLSNYVMPSKAFDSNNKLYNTYSDEATAVLELQYLEHNDIFIGERPIITGPEFLFHYSNVPLFTASISLNHLYTIPDDAIINKQIFIELQLSTSLDSYNPIPIRITPINISNDNNDAKFVLIEPLPTYDLDNGHAVRVDLSVLCIGVTCNRRYFNYLASGAANIYKVSHPKHTIDFRKMSLCYEQSIPNSVPLYKYLGYTSEQAFNISNPANAPIKQASIYNYVIYPIYSFNTEDYNQDISSEMDDYSLKLSQDFVNYHQFDGSWLFLSIIYSLFVQFLVDNSPKEYNLRFYNPLSFSGMLSNDFHVIYSRIKDYAITLLKVTSDERYVTGTSIPSIHHFTNRVPFSLNIATPSNVPLPSKPSNSNPSNSTELSQQPENSQSTEQNLSVTSQPGLTNLLTNTGAIKPSNHTTISNSPDQTQNPSTDIQPTLGVTNSGNLQSSSSGLSSDSVPDFAGPNNASDLIPEFGTLTINDPRLFYSVAGFPALYPSVIQTLSPTDLANLSLNHSIVPSNLSSLPLKSYTPLLPFKQHPLPQPEEDVLFESLVGLFQSWSTKDDLANYEPDDINLIDRNYKHTSFGSIYNTSRVQSFTIANAISRFLRDYDTDPLFHLYNLFNKLSNANISNDDYLSHFLTLDSNNNYQISTALVDHSSFITSAQSLRNVLPHPSLDLRSLIYNSNLKIYGTYSTLIPYSQLQSNCTFHASIDSPYESLNTILKNNHSMTSRIDQQLLANLICYHSLYSNKHLTKVQFFDNIINLMNLDTMSRSNSLSIKPIGTTGVNLSSYLNKPTIISCLCSTLINNFW